ncbi:MAG: type II toxin-antitoxin system PemK/MazF family toxin [Candidatus Pacebacteria bacterium]|nr:type II toxin-antitoxin system PemK/MazF family toxin [Candidatus Paceibacterota bacterium]
MQEKRHKIAKGDIFIVNNTDANGHEQKGVRPHVVVTQVTGSTVTVAPCTTSTIVRKYSVLLLPDAQNHLHRKSYVLIAQAFAADVSFLGEKIGHLDTEDILRIQLEYVKYVTD